MLLCNPEVKMDPKIIFLVATLCMVNASLRVVEDHGGDGYPVAADPVNVENIDLSNLNENVEAPVDITADEEGDTAGSTVEERIRICSSRVCDRVCRLLNLGGKCVKKRCKCIAKGLSTLDDANDEPQNNGLNFKESDEGSVEDSSIQELEPADFFIDQRLRICRFNICNRVCRALNKKGKCVKKRCKCVAKARSADSEIEEPENNEPVVKEDQQDADMGISDQVEDPSDAYNEERIRICSSSVCKRVCRLLQLDGKCVKRNCKCTPKASSLMAHAALMAENPSLFAEY